MSHDYRVWQPWSARETGTVGLREGVPVALRGPLRDWLLRAASEHPTLARRVLLRLDVPVPDGPNAETAWSVRVEHGNDHALLDTVDAMLNLMPIVFVTGVAPFHSRIRLKALGDELAQHLTDARSVYRVKANGSGLERRVNPIAAAMVDAAIKSSAAVAEAGSAAAQLRAASDAVRAPKPEPDEAYGLAIKAVESAAHAHRRAEEREGDARHHARGHA